MDFDAVCNCGGKVNVNDWQLNRSGLFYHKEVENALFLQTEYSFSHREVSLFNCVMPGAIAVMNLKHLTSCMEMQLKILSRHNRSITISGACDDRRDYFSIRKMVCEFILYFRAYMNSIRWDLSILEIIEPEISKDVDTLFGSIKQFFSTLHSIPDSTLLYAASNLGNKCKQPEFHLYHMHIELRWFFVTLMRARTMWYQDSIHMQLEEFENTFATVINDLIYSALKVFERLSLNWTTDLKQKTPYNCTCIRELWLMLQIFIDNFEERVKTKVFWDHVNVCINKILDKNQTEVMSWHRRVSPLSDCKNSELFCIWIIYHLSLLYGYSSDGIYLQSSSPRIRSNYEQVEKILKVYVCKGGKDGERDELDTELKIIIPLLHDLIINWWKPRISVVSLGLWDCFHKRLDQPFLQQTSGPWALSFEKKSAADILKQINDRIDGKFEQSKESSYSMFLHLLGTFLKNYSKMDAKYWNQVKGRVYTRFSKSKVREFSESGLYNFISLFITLAITADTTNVCLTMLELLPSTNEVNNENNKKHNLVWKGKLVCLLLFNEKGLSFSSIANHFTETINLISCRKDEVSRSMMTNFVDVLNKILSGNEKMDLGEHHFIGGWIDRYLLECPKNRIAALLGMLANVFEKCVLQVSCDNSDGARKILDALWCFVASRVRQLVFDPVLSGDNYKDIAKLAVIFTLEGIRDPATAKKYKHSVASLFQHFAASIFIKDTRITQYYLASLLEDSQTVRSLKTEIVNFDTTLIQAWVKCSIVGHGTDKEELKILQYYITEIYEIQDIFVSADDLQEFRNSNEPILTFIISLMKRQNLLKSEQERFHYSAKCRTYFKNLEKWVLIPITEETRDSEAAFWIYRCLGTLILCISPILYTKNQPNDMLRTLVNKVILVPENSTQPYIKQLGKRIFSMMILGLEKLNVKGDIILQAMIRDIFDQYLPILITEINSGASFKISDILLKCFKEATCEFMRSIFEMLMSNFYSTSSDNVMHKHSILITWLIKTLLKDGKTYPRYIVEHIIQVCLPNIFGCYMKVHDHHPHKLHTIDFISDVIKSPYYEENKIIRVFFSEKNSRLSFPLRCEST
ncbi:PREDICTED: protein MMS22-like isoform X2 [Dinoponera quadriceps]|uniref:Protein MMS22-like n=1 Tax=Dinoponera quadriceps TaxID=609295 RepID=A0A6P3XFI9_DINQU|nr:PREDICTED: protein MMS22-like isoform X2 [Dinoponera quadriceps]